MPRSEGTRHVVPAFAYQSMVRMRPPYQQLLVNVVLVSTRNLFVPVVAASEDEWFCSAAVIARTLPGRFMFYVLSTMT